MGRRAEIDDHPQKQQIISAIVRGDSYGKISAKYGISKSALTRYLKGRLVPSVAKARERVEFQDGKTVLELLQQAMVRIHKMYDACDEYLRDPEHPDKYTLDPRARELMVVYQTIEHVENDKGGYDKRITHREDLQTLLDRAMGQDGEWIEVKYRHADPRKLILETASVVSKQLELGAKLLGEIGPVEKDFTGSPVFAQIQVLVLQATQDYPEAQQKIASALMQMSEEQSET